MAFDIELCTKVSEKRWIESLRKGTACFNPVDVFIKKAENNGNNEQGDKYEGIFARIKEDDIRLHALKNRYGDDLEVIPDRGYVLLRRKSSRKVSIFCTYGVRRDELHIIEDSVHEENGKYFGTVNYDFPEKIYNGFLDSNDVWGFYASSGHFFEALKRALRQKKLVFKDCVVSYDIDLDKEFYLEPDDAYSELEHKRVDLKYQHEIRYRLLNFPREKEFLLPYEPLSDRSCGIAPGALRLEMHCKCSIH